MKKTLYILIILFVVKNLYAGPFVRFETGPMFEASYWLTEINIGIRGELKNTKHEFYGGWSGWSQYDSMPWPGNFFQQAPTMQTYTIGYKFSYKWFFTRIHHYCSHPVVSGAKMEEEDIDAGKKEYVWERPQKWWYGLGTTFTIGIEFEYK